MSERDCENCKHHTEKGCKSWDCEFEQRITRKEAIKRLKVWLICVNCPEEKQCYDSYLRSTCEYTDYCDEVNLEDAIKVAINSLEIDERYELEYEQIEPCEDAISRQAVLDATVKRNSIWNKITNSKGENLEEIILQLPPVNPTKTGHWEQYGNFWEEKFKCSECGKEQPKILCGERIIGHWSDYCPNCGCRMVEPQEQESEDKE